MQNSLFNHYHMLSTKLDKKDLGCGSGKVSSTSASTLP